MDINGDQEKLQLDGALVEFDLEMEEIAWFDESVSESHVATVCV